MANGQPTNEVKAPDPAVKTKRYNLSTTEMETIKNIQSVKGILMYLQEGMRNSLMIEISRAQQRVGIKETDAPEGFVRTVNFDPNKFELVVTDLPKDVKPVEKPAEPVKALN